MRILVVGTGAIGSVFGGMLAEAGHQVSLIDKQQSLIAAIAQRGLEIDGVLGKHAARKVAAYTSAADVRRQHFDLILIATKSYDTEQAIKEVLPLISPDTVIVSLQNGLGNLEVIADAVGSARTLGASIMFGAVIKATGVVEVTANPESLKLGSPGAMPKEQVESIARVFNEAGITSEATPEIMKYIWGKLLLNCCLNPLSALLECDYRETWESKEIRDIMSAIIREGFAVARGKGITLQWQEPQEYEHLLFDVLIPNSFSHISSMLQDIRQGRRTEIDAINGAVAKLGKELGVDTPVNELLAKLVKTKEKLRRKRAGIEAKS